MREYFFYILASEKRTIYTGVTNHLERRIWEHRERVNPGFASEHGCDQLVYSETCGDIRNAINREKQIKGLSRAKKIALIEAENPDWRDLSAEW